MLCYIVVFTKKFPEVFEPKPSNLKLGKSILIWKSDTALAHSRKRNCSLNELSRIILGKLVTE